MNPYVDYYANQAGSGISGFVGNRFQRGHGFFGRLFSNTVLPMLKFLGRHALTTGVNVAQDVIKGGPPRETIKKHLLQTGVNVSEDALERLKKYTQSGSGLKRKRKSSKKTTRGNKKKRRTNCFEF